MSTYVGQNIYYSALKKSGVRYKGGIHTLRHYPEFRTIPSNRLPSFVSKESGQKYSA
jgi:hypothetical protein